MKYLFIILFNVLAFISEAQTKPGTSFYENETKDLSVCPESLSALTDAQVENLLKELLEGFSLKMSYIVVSCPQIDNCQAIIHKGKPYILYNAAFLDEVKRLNFSQKELPTSEKNWKALTILAHELGHHLNNHLSNPLPGMSNIDLELGADITAGFIIYTIGGTIAQAQLAFKDIPEADSYTHPGRQKRLDAVAKGWNDAFMKYSKSKMTAAEANLKAEELLKAKDLTGALRYYSISAELGNAVGQYNLGYLYDAAEGIGQDYFEALKWYRKAAEQGYPLAQLKFGFMYEWGKGVSKNMDEAKKWYIKAADQNQLGSQLRLGYILEAEANYTEAIKWYRKAANQGSELAQDALGNFYSDGKGGTKDYTEAVFWYRKAAEQGYDIGQYHLGYMYANGKGVNQDYLEAAKWYGKAAVQGQIGALISLGQFYMDGTGFNRDYTEAANWYRKAAERGSSVGNYWMGYFYETGKGVTKNIPEAVKWYLEAAKQGDGFAKEKLKALGYSY